METSHNAAESGPRHETRDANVRGLLIFVAGLTFVVVLTMWGMYRVFFYFKATQSQGPPASPFVTERTLPPLPRLQVAPRIDLQQLRAGEDRTLDSYGWVDKSAGIAHIPIERAMDLVAQKGLPVRIQTGGKQ